MNRFWKNDKGEYHREDGPAYISESGLGEAWYYNGKKHRYCGPAATDPYGVEYWYIHGKLITKEVNAWIEEYGFDSDWRSWTEADRILFRLMF